MRNGFRLFDDFIDEMFESPFYKGEAAASFPQLMRTDILEKDGKYLFDVELPGYAREDVQAELKDGYLTITANHNQAIENRDEKTNYVRKERYTGRVRRSFYVGEEVTEHDIQAGFKDGILKIMIDKPRKKELEDNRKLIPIL